jgi:hypothetical protein
MLLRYFLSFIRKEQPTFLGRWKLENCVHKRNNKIDWANEDHCGTCSIKLKLYENIQQNNTVRPLNVPKMPLSTKHTFVTNYRGT